MIGAMEPRPEECEQLARSLSMSSSLGTADRHRVIELLRHLADMLRAPGARPEQRSSAPGGAPAVNGRDPEQAGRVGR